MNAKTNLLNHTTILRASSRIAAAWQFGILSLLSAFLLFQVQPVIGKFILPWFGGGPGVWTTCLLFFQVLLFAGYAYAHALTRLPRRWQGIIHGALVLAAVATLPIAPGPQWRPTFFQDPTRRILELLLVNVALPYFVLSSTSPLVQVWFSRSGENRSPWRLYALSNIGSLVALLTYPFFIEPRWDVMQQTWMWSGGFLIFGLLSWAGVLSDWKRASMAGPLAVPEAVAPVSERWSLGWRRVLWVMLTAVASVLLLAATNHICQDVAVIPFLWVLPLGLYLLSFIICFNNERWYVRTLWALPAMGLLAAAGTHESIAKWLTQLRSVSHLKWLPADLTPSLTAEIALACGAMFLGCMVCHGELARLKPDRHHLTEYYLMISAGGALGGLFVALAAPHLFTTYLEWPVALVVCFIIAALALLDSASRQQRRQMRIFLRIAVVAVAVPGLAYFLTTAFEVEDRIVRVRNFYGAISVADEFQDQGTKDSAEDIVVWRTLYHGEIVHGYQYLDEELRNQPLSYYGHETGIGLALLTIKDRPDARVGVVGMGAATVAAYGSRGQTFRFYDINPAIVKLAREEFYFLGDLEKRGGKVEVALGDARRSLETEPPQQFDVLLLDAFSGDSVPVHLLTLEAFEIYQRHIKPDGIIVVHVTNRYLNLAPVVEKVASSRGWKTTRISTDLDRLDETTVYVIVTNNEDFFKTNSIRPNEPGATIPVTLWTDRSNNLFEIWDG